MKFSVKFISISMILLLTIFVFKIDESKATIVTAITDLLNSDGQIVRVAATASNEDISNIGYWLYSYNVSNISQSDGIYGFEVANPFNYNIEGVCSPINWGFASLNGYFLWDTSHTTGSPMLIGQAQLFQIRTQQGYPGLVWAEARDRNDCTGKTLSPVPEPATMLLLAPALLGLIGIRRRKK